MLLTKVSATADTATSFTCFVFGSVQWVVLDRYRPLTHIGRVRLRHATVKVLDGRLCVVYVGACIQAAGRVAGGGRGSGCGGCTAVCDGVTCDDRRKQHRRLGLLV